MKSNLFGVCAPARSALIVLAASLFFIWTSSYAKAITLNACCDINFGPVPVFTTSSLPNSILAIASLDAGYHVVGWSVNLGGGDSSLFSKQISAGGGCTTQIFCMLDVSFLPTTPGVKASSIFFNLIESNADETDLKGSNLVTVNLIGLGVEATPLPAAFPLFATGLGALGLFSWRKRRKAAALAG